MSGTSGETYVRYLAANVRRLRLSQGLTQEALAEEAAMDLHYLRRIERSTANPTVQVLASLANALGVRAGLLLRKTTSPERKPGRPMRKGARGRKKQ